MRSAKPTSRNIGSSKSPIHLGHGFCAYRRNGRWHYRTPETSRRFGLSFVEAKDPKIILEMISRSYQALYPQHECVDHPNLPCSACERDALRALGIDEGIL